MKTQTKGKTMNGVTRREVGYNYAKQAFASEEAGNFQMAWEYVNAAKTCYELESDYLMVHMLGRESERIHALWVRQYN